MNDIAVKVDHVSMRFNLSTEKVDSMKEYFIKRLKRDLVYDEFWALKDVNSWMYQLKIFLLVCWLDLHFL